MIVEQFIELVNCELEKRGMTRRALSIEMGVTPQTVNSYLNGHRSPGPEVMERFFTALNLEPKLSCTEVQEKVSA